MSVETLDDGAERWTYEDALSKAFTMARAIGTASDWALLATALHKTKSVIMREPNGRIVVTEEVYR